MTELELGDRHNRAVAGLGRGTDPKIIRLVAGTLGSSIPRQHLMVCLVNLLSRLHGSVKAIQLDVAGDIIVPLPNGARPGNAFEVMKEMARWANGDRIPVLDVTGASDIAIDISAGAEAGADLYAWGAGWKGWVGSSPATFSRSDDDPSCLGPYFAAAMAAGEVFKISKGLLKGRFAGDEAYSLWSGAMGCWNELADGPPVHGHSLPTSYLIGAGAVGQGVVQVVGASRLAEAFLITIDHDLHDKQGTNLNRCFLAGVPDILEAKVEAVKRYRERTGLAGYEFQGSLDDYLISSHPGLPPAIAEAQRRDSFDLVISAVDINRSRQTIQGLRPKVIVGGSTDGLRAQSALYGVIEGAECLGCWNEPEDDKAKAAALEAQLRNLSAEEQRQTLAGKVDDLDAALAYLASAKPRCGQLGEAEVRSFATAVSPEFSVSFVSMAAAVMTVARLFAATLFTDQASSRAAKGLFQFKNLEVDEVTTARRPACSYCQPLKMPEAARLRDSPPS
ncbi:MAG: hypothetical protein Q8R63_07380 [Ramlibacter sp.]|nr:hypothetical protein [Ramlibacter sp.]